MEEDEQWLEAMLEAKKTIQENPRLSGVLEAAPMRQPGLTIPKEENHPGGTATLYNLSTQAIHIITKQTGSLSGTRRLTQMS